MTLVIAALVAVALALWPRRADALRVVAQHIRPPEQTVPVTSADALASVVVLLAMALRSGCGVVEALEAVGRRSNDVAGRHLLQVAAALRWGCTDRQAWALLPEAWAPVARAFTLARRAGVPPADLLVRVADDMREAERARLELATAKLGVRVVIPLGVAFLPAFILTTVVPIVVGITGDVLKF